MSERMNPTCYNVDLTIANTEYSQQLPVGCRYFTIQARQAADIRFALESGKVGTPTEPYMTLKSGMAYNAPEKMEVDGLSRLTVYIASATAGTDVEILAWS